MGDGTDKILADTTDGVGWLTLNNPARRNAIDLEMWQAMGAVLDRFESDASVRAIVVRGAGGTAFTSGADISRFEDGAAYKKISREGRDRVAAVRKPLIAMIDGFCIGGGVTLASMADLRVASDKSVFVIASAKLGIAYEFESLIKVVRLIGPAFAKDLLLTGRRVTADEAFRMGLVSRVVPADRLEATVRDLAMQIARNAPLSVLAAKTGIDQFMLDPGARDMAAVEASIRACYESEDCAIGREAFAAKRTPEFTGR